MSEPFPAPENDVSDLSQARTGRAWLPCLLSCLLIVILGLTIGIPKINSDGRRYFAMALSLAQDGDFDLANQRGVAGGLRLRGGRWITPYAPGFAVFYYPVLRSVLLLAKNRGAIADLSLVSAVGTAGMAHEALAVLAGSVLFGVAALWLSCRSAQAVAGTWHGAAAALTCFAGTQLVGYCLFWPSFAHALDAALVSVGLWALIRATSHKPGTALPYCLAGFALGAATTVRMVNVATLAGAIVVALVVSGNMRARFGRAAAVGGGSLPPLALLAIYQLNVYGRLLGGGYEQAVVLWPRYLLSPLLYRPYGLLHWSPFLLMAGAGWFLLPRRDVRIACAVPFAVTVLALGFYSHHQEGAYSGCRYLVQFQVVFSIGLAGFLEHTRRLPRGRRRAARTTTWAAAAYSLALVPLAWWPTPQIPLADGNQELDPAAILTSFAHAVWRDARTPETAKDNLVALLPRPPLITPMSLLLGRWGPGTEPWINVMEPFLTSDRPPASARQLSVVASTRNSMVATCWPVAPGWPTVASFRLPRAESAARSESWTLSAGSQRVTCTVSGREDRPAWSDGDLAVFADIRKETQFLHVLLARPCNPETLVWISEPGTDRLPVPRAPCDEHLRFLCIAWAASGAEVIEPSPPEVHQTYPHRFPGQVGDPADYESITETGWTYAPSAPPAEPFVLCMALGWRGNPELLVECADGRQAKSGPLDRPCPRTRPEGWLVLTGSAAGGYWMRGACYVVTGLGEAISLPITLSLAPELESGAVVRVLRYGDAWRRDRRARLPKAWGYPRASR